MTIKCPTCGYDNREGVLLCNLCGMVFRKAANARSETSEEPKPEAAASVSAPAEESPTERLTPPEPTAVLRPAPVVRTAVEWNDHGAALYKEQKFEEALGCFEEALTLAPRFARALGNKATSLFQLGQQEVGVKLVDKALALAPTALESWFNKAAMEKTLGRGAEALRTLQEFLSLADGTEHDLKSAAQQMASELEKIGAEPAPRTALGWLAEGARLAERADFAQAATALDEALACDPRLGAAWRRKGEAVLQLEGPAEALVCFDTGLDCDPQDPRLWHRKGFALARLGRLDEALPAFDRALELEPQLAAGWADRGRALRVLGRFPEALESLDKAIALAPNAPPAWFDKALSEDTLRREAEARRSYRRFMDLASPEMTRPLAWARERLAALSPQGASELVSASPHDSSPTPGSGANRLK
jgi:tetratricopeptide (TPR) repeat protein